MVGHRKATANKDSDDKSRRCLRAAMALITEVEVVLLLLSLLNKIREGKLV